MDKATVYDFSDRERGYFERLQQQFNTSIASGIQMILSQQGFEGQWRMKADGSGIERVDMPQTAAFVEPAELKAAVKKANGLA